jgi:selenocysteine lyase/cysteine desulfurase
MSAASNVTGIVTDTVAVSELVHKYGALAVWDYATAGMGLLVASQVSGVSAGGC